MIRKGVFDRTPKAPIRRIGTKVGTVVIINARVIISEMRIKTATTTSTGVTMVTEMIGVGSMFHLKNVKLFIGMVEVV